MSYVLTSRHFRVAMWFWGFMALLWLPVALTGSILGFLVCAFCIYACWANQNKWAELAQHEYDNRS